MKMGDEQTFTPVGQEADTEPNTGTTPVFGHKAKPPSVRQQSWGTFISIVIIVCMIIIGAFYAWGERIAANQNTIPSSTGTSTP